MATGTSARQGRGVEPAAKVARSGGALRSSCSGNSHRVLLFGFDPVTEQEPLVLKRNLGWVSPSERDRSPQVRQERDVDGQCSRRLLPIGVLRCVPLVSSMVNSYQFAISIPESTTNRSLDERSSAEVFLCSPVAASRYSQVTSKTRLCAWAPAVPASRTQVMTAL